MVMKKMVILSLFVLPLYSNVIAQNIDKELESILRNEVASFQGHIGIYVQHIETNTAASIRGDSLFPTASIVKIPLLVGVFHMIKTEELKLSDNFIYRTNQAYGGSGLMQHYRDSTQTDLSTMISLMLTYSDNVASIWCQQLAGGGATINKLMDDLGLYQTKVNSRTAGREDIWKKYGWGQTTPHEIAKLMLLIRQGKVFSPQLSDKMYRYLKNQFFNERSLAAIPAHIATASKTGSLEDVRGEVVFVHAPSSDYVFSVLTKSNKDQRWERVNEAEVLTRRISQVLWNYFEPKQPFEAFEYIP